MKKMIQITCVLIAGIIVLLASTASVQSASDHRNMPVIRVEKASSPIKITGNGDSPAWKKAKNYASRINGYIDSNTSKRLKRGTSGMAYVRIWKLLWDAKGLYSYIRMRLIGNIYLFLNVPNFSFFYGRNQWRTARLYVV